MDDFRFMDEDELSLEHHGIKGMKWGVRRTPEQLGHRVAAATKRAASAAGKATSAASNATAAVRKAGGTAAKKVSDAREARRDRIVGKAMASDASAKDIRRALPHMTDDEIKKKMDRNALEDRMLSADAAHKKGVSELTKTSQAIKKGMDLGDTEGVKKAQSKFVEEALSPIAGVAGKAAGQQVLSKSAEFLTKVAAKKIGISEEDASEVASFFKETLYSEDFAAAAISQRMKFKEKNYMGDQWEEAKDEAKRNAAALKDQEAAREAERQRQAWARQQAEREEAAYRAGMKQGARDGKRAQKEARRAERAEARKRRKAQSRGKGSQQTSSSTALARTNRSYVDDDTVYEW